MKKVVIMLAVVSTLCGCATFGTFSGLKKGKTTKGEVRSMLSEPATRRYDDGGEVWEYHFTREDGRELGRLETVMNLAISFKKDVVADYEVTVSKESGEEEGPEKPTRSRRPGAGPRPPGRGQRR